MGREWCGHRLDVAEIKGNYTRHQRVEWLQKFYGTHEQLARENHPLRRLWLQFNVHNAWFQRVREICWDRSDGMNRPLATLLWLAKDRSHLNPWLDGIAICGLCISAVVLILGAANVPLMLTLWTCRRVNCDQQPTHMEPFASPRIIRVRAERF